MRKRDEDWRTKAVETATTGGAAALEGVLGGATGSAGAVLVKAGLALVPGVVAGTVKLGIQAYNRRIEKKIQDWMDLVAVYMDRGSIDAAAEEINEHIDEEWAHSAVVEGVRAILSDINAAAVPFLARVTAYYLCGQRVIDRRLARPHP